MGKIYLDCKGIDDLAHKLGSLGDKARGAVTEMLTVGSDLMIDGLQRACDEYGHVRTGGLRKSIQRKGNVVAFDDGGFVIVTFKGKNKSGTRYGEIAYYLNYGTHGNAGDNWIDNSVELLKPICEDAMEQVLNRHLSRNT